VDEGSADAEDGPQHKHAQDTYVGHTQENAQASDGGSGRSDQQSRLRPRRTSSWKRAKERVGVLKRLSLSRRRSPQKEQEQAGRGKATVRKAGGKRGRLSLGRSARGRGAGEKDETEGGEEEGDAFVQTRGF
jgi:hypothetical protein